MKNVLKPLASVLSGEVSVRIANLCFSLLIARVFGGAALGIYAACIATVTLVVMFADNGLQTTAILELSGVSSERARIVGKLYLCKTILTFAALLVLIGIGLRMKLTPFEWMVALWVTLRTVLQSYCQLHMSFLKAVSRASVIGPIQFAHAFLLLLGIALTYKRGLPLSFLLTWLAAGQLCELGLTGVVLWRTGFRLGWPAQNSFWPTIRMSMPLGIAYGLGNAIVRVDTLVLAAFVSLSDLGNFSAANTLLAVFYVASWLFGSVLLPEIVSLSSSPEVLKAYTRRWAVWIVSTMAPGALLAYVTAPKLMALLYGPKFVGSGVLASTMALACPLILLNSLYTNVAIAINAKSVYLGVLGATAVITLALDFFLGRAFSSTGVAVAIVIRELGMLTGFWLLMSRRLSPAVQVGYLVSS